MTKYEVMDALQEHIEELRRKFDKPVNEYHAAEYDGAIDAYQKALHLVRKIEV